MTVNLCLTTQISGGGKVVLHQSTVQTWMYCIFPFSGKQGKKENKGKKTFNDVKMFDFFGFCIVKQ